MNDAREAATAEAAARLERLTGPDTTLDHQDTEDLRMVLHSLRVYRFERDGANASVKRIASFREQDSHDHKARMRRIWALIDRKRKTVPMDALYAALMDPLAKTEATTPTTTNGDRS